MTAIRVSEFDIWRAGFGGSSVVIRAPNGGSNLTLYSDEALTTVLTPNPQVLDSQTEDGVIYGKFSVPVYVNAAYELFVDSLDVTGIVRPGLTTLAAQDASEATVMPTGGSVATTLEELFARNVFAEDYGELGASAATNTTTLTAAIGVAAANGGGFVYLPPGTFYFTSLSLSAGVILAGGGRAVTTLACQTAAECITISGDGAGLQRLTLDGINLVVGGVGVYSKANDEIFFSDVDIKRFETGIHIKGARRSNWKDLYLTACTTGAKLHGDIDSGGGSDGDEYRNNAWVGGLVSLCTTTGVEFSYVDRKCWHNSLSDVGFESNAGTALIDNGAQQINLDDCWFTGNTVNITLDDDSDTTANPDNQIVGFLVKHSNLNGGTITATGQCQDVIYEKCSIEDVDITLTAPGNDILVKDCTEDTLVTLSGDGEKWVRIRSVNHGQSSGLTTDATPTKAWSIELNPGQRCFLEAKVIGNQKEAAAGGEYHFSVSAHRPGSALAYDGQTANFTAGETLTGATSGATALIQADSDSGTTGTLTLRDIVGVFENNEVITDGAGGDALANGILVPANAALLGAVTALRTAREDVAGWDATFAVNATEVELQVTGAAGDTVEWLCDVESVLT